MFSYGFVEYSFKNLFSFYYFVIFYKPFFIQSETGKIWTVRKGWGRGKTQDDPI